MKLHELWMPIVFTYIVATFIIFGTEGCFFSAKEIILDPDKGITHSEVIEHAKK